MDPRPGKEAEDMKEKMLTNEERISENSDTIHDMNSTNSDVKSLVPGAEVVDPSSGDNHLPQEGNSVGEILRELGAELNKDLRQTMSVLLADMADMKEKMEEIGKIEERGKM